MATRETNQRPPGTQRTRVALAESLGYATHLGLAAFVQRGDGADAQTVFGLQEPVHGFCVGEAAVTQNNEGASQFTERFCSVEEVGRNLPHSVEAVREQSAVLNQATHLTDLESKDFGEIGNCEPLHIGKVRHELIFPRSAHKRGIRRVFRLS
jgi:hypothetical protein